MANNEELNLVRVDESEHYANPTLSSIEYFQYLQQDVLGSPISDLDNFTNTLNDDSSSDVSQPQIDENVSKIIEENDAGLDIENSIKTFSIQRIQFNDPLRDFPTILELKEVVVTFTIEPNVVKNSSTKHIINADFVTETESEYWGPSRGSLQYNKEFQMHLSRQLAIDQSNYNKMLIYSVQQKKVARGEGQEQPLDEHLQARVKRLLQEYCGPSSGSMQYNKEFHMHLARQLAIDQSNYNKMLIHSVQQKKVARVESQEQPLDEHLQARAKRLLQRLAPTSNCKIEYVNNGNGIVNPNYRAPVNNADDCRTCLACMKTFQRASDFNRHMSKHSNIKRFLCIFCGKGFYDLFDLKRHTRTHTGIRPYPCQYCRLAFRQLSTLEKHKNAVHCLPILYDHNQRRDKLFICEDCGESTYSEEVLETHIENAHPFKLAKTQ